MITVDLKTNPDLKRIITAAFPGYKKHKAFISAFGEHGVNINSFWDGGSRDEYAVVDLHTTQRKTLPTRSHPFFDVAAKGLTNQSSDILAVDHVGNVTLKVLPENFALVSAGTQLLEARFDTFCGKPATAHVYLNPANMPKFLEAPKS